MKMTKPNDFQEKVKPNDFRKILILGLVGIISVILGDIFQVMKLRISGIVILAVMFVINSKILMNRMDKLEKEVE